MFRNEGKDKITEIGIDSEGRLFVKPKKQTFQYIYRAAAEVNWDEKKKVLFSPKQTDWSNWSYYQWYIHIIEIAKSECDCRLYLTNRTKWTNIQHDLKQQILDL
jgi:hypothetical protein